MNISGTMTRIYSHVDKRCAIKLLNTKTQKVTILVHTLLNVCLSVFAPHKTSLYATTRVLDKSSAEHVRHSPRHKQYDENTDYRRDVVGKTWMRFFDDGKFPYIPRGSRYTTQTYSSKN